MQESEQQRIERELTALKQRMDELYFESLAARESDTQDPKAEAVTWEPMTDVWESGEEWLLVSDLPGVLDADLQVVVDDEYQLTISGNRAISSPENFIVSVKERPEGSFSRTFILPFRIREDTIKAKFKQGVLTVSIPKSVDRGVPSHKIIVQPG
ncbi:MAG: Hsp20/alpha crystallin family protein [Syntrophobacteraceae bacterium]